jgi:hypothetical protein
MKMNIVSALMAIHCIPTIVLVCSSIFLNSTIAFALRGGSMTQQSRSIDLKELNPYTRSKNLERKGNIFTGWVRKGVVSEANQAVVILPSTHRRAKTESNISPVSTPNSSYPSLHSSSKPTTAMGSSPSYLSTYHVPSTLTPGAQVTSKSSSVASTTASTPNIDNNMSKTNEIKMRCYSSDEERDHLKLTLVRVKFLYALETTSNFNFNHEITSLEKTISKAVASHFLSCNNNSQRTRHRRIAAFHESSIKQSPMLLAVDYHPRDKISSTGKTNILMTQRSKIIHESFFLNLFDIILSSIYRVM